MRRASVAAAVALAAAGCNTAPGSSLSNVERMYIVAAATWDLDKDGVVTCDEWKAYAGELFDRADTNRNGVLTADEFNRISADDKLFTVADFSFFDAGRKGSITRAEFVNRPNPAFRVLDKTGSCRLTSAELAGGRALTQGIDTAPTPKEDGSPKSRR